VKLRACFLIPVILNLTGLPPARAQDQDQAETLKVWGATKSRARPLQVSALQT